jgi:hypothetical protein
MKVKCPNCGAEVECEVSAHGMSHKILKHACSNGKITVFKIFVFNGMLQEVTLLGEAPSMESTSAVKVKSERTIFKMDPTPSEHGALFLKESQGRKLFERNDLAPNLYGKARMVEDIVEEAKNAFGVKSVSLKFFYDDDIDSPYGSATGFLGTANISFNLALSDPDIIRYTAFHEMAHYLIDMISQAEYGGGLEQCRKEWACDLLSVIYGGPSALEGLKKGKTSTDWVISVEASLVQLQMNKHLNEDDFLKIIKTSSVALQLRGSHPA